MTSHWESKSLGEVCQFISRGVSPAYVDSGGISVLNQKCVRHHQVNVNLGRRHDATAKKVAPDKLLRAGDVLVNSTGTGTLGRVAQLREDPLEPTTADSHVTIVRPAIGLFHLDFFGYALIAIEEEIQAGGEGCGGQTELARGKLAGAYRVSFPTDLKEQQHIVAILDEAFEGIGIAKANAEKNLQNARELVAALSEDLFKVSSDQGANDQSLAELCEFIVDCEHKTAPTQDEGIPLIRTPNIGAGQLILDGVYRVSEETYKEWTRRAEPKPGDLILAREAPAGNVAVIPDGARVCLGQRTVLIRPKSSVFDSTYLAHLLLCASSQKRLLAHSRGATVQHINMKDIRAFKVHVVPPLDEQRRIVSKLKSLIGQGDLLAQTQSRKLAALEELKKSLLHQAFSGRLTSSEQRKIAQQPVLQTTTPEFSANIISLAYARHERQKRGKTFGHVKEQKLLHLVESIAGIDLGRQPMRDAAGPNDFQHMLRADNWAKAHGFYDMVKRGDGYEFSKLSSFDEHASRARQALTPYLSRLEPVIDLLVPMDTEDAEVFTTVHAAWNNLLIDGVQATDDAIVSAARQGWHPDKLKISEHKFRSAIDKIRQKKLAPNGSAKYVGGQKALFDESILPRNNAEDSK